MTNSALPGRQTSTDASAAQHRYGEIVEGNFHGDYCPRRTGRKAVGGGTCRLERPVRGHHPRGHINSLRQTAIGLATGHTLDEHENTGEITLQIIRGRARVVAASDDAELVAGDYVVIPIEWDSFEALEDTVVLLTAAVQGTPD